MTLDKLLSQIKSADPRIIEARRWIDEPNPYRVNSDSVDKLVIEFRTTKEVGRGWVDINQLVDALDDEVGEYCIPGAQFKRALPPIDDFDAEGIREDCHHKLMRLEFLLRAAQGVDVEL